jgi:hypothetical protein
MPMLARVDSGGATHEFVDELHRLHRVDDPASDGCRRRWLEA